MGKENFLGVRVAKIGKTYVGGTFCRSEEAFRDIFEGLTPDQAFAVNDARRDVQEGEPVETVLSTLIVGDALGRSKYMSGHIAACLAKISSGDCAVYPVANPEV